MTSQLQRSKNIEREKGLLIRQDLNSTRKRLLIKQTDYYLKVEGRFGALFCPTLLVGGLLVKQKPVALVEEI